MLRNKQRAGRKPTAKKTAAKKVVKKQQKRKLHSATKPVAQQQATIWGSYGAIGRYAAQYLGPTGMRIIAPYRDSGMHDVRDIKLVGDVGQVAPLYFDWKDKDSIVRTMEGSDLVINTIGTFRNRRHFSIYDANFRTAFKIAKHAKEQGVERFIHVSAAGAAEHANSDFLKSKWESEQAVLSLFPNASIIRPCMVYDMNSHYVNRLARQAATLIDDDLYVAAADTLVQPTYARDVGAAIAQIALHPQIDGQLWTLGGSHVVSRRELFETLCRMVGHEGHEAFEARDIHNMGPFDTILRHFKEEHLRLSSNQQLYRDTQVGDVFYFLEDITTDKYSKTKGFEELGIKPASFDSTFLRLVQPYMQSTAPAAQEKLFSFRSGGLEDHKKIM
eukprot:UN04447